MPATSTEILSGPNVEQRRVLLEEDAEGYTAEGEIVSTQTVSSKTRTVETITVSYLTGILKSSKLTWEFFSVQNGTRWSY